MKRADIIKLIGLCSINYRNWPEAGKEEMVIALWSRMLSDVDFETAQIAIEKYMSESVYPPTVADLRQRISEITTPMYKTAIEAWGDLSKAILRYGYYQQEKALEMLDPITRKVVDALGFRYLCLSTDVMADRAHFLKVYDNLVERERKESLLMLDTKEAMYRIQHENKNLMRIGGSQ